MFGANRFAFMTRRPDFSREEGLTHEICMHESVDNSNNETTHGAGDSGFTIFR
jgi:hypothetical protein